MRPAAGRPRALRVVALLAVAAAGCAKREAPSGGPPDLTPPRVIASSPDSGAAGVPLDAALSVTFSEGMEPRATGEAVALAPHVEVRKRRWSGRKLTLELAEGLRPDQTYTLFVGGTARDRHGNTLTGAAIVFSTGDRFPSGRIEGEIEARGFPARGTFLWCYDAARGGEPDSTARDFDALGVADDDGVFRIDGLTVPGRYRLWAFADLNGNRSFEPANDVLAPADTVIELTEAAPVARDLALRVANPRTPGRVRGAVLDSLADTLGVLRVVAVSEKDTTRRVTVEADAEEGGEFDLELEAGVWTLRGFRDLDRNRTWQPAKEPASEPRRLTVEPAADIVDVRLRLVETRGGPPSGEKP